LFKQQTDLQSKLIIARNQALQILINQIKADVKTIAEKQHYDLVLTKTSVAYNADNIDITKQVEALVKE
jgi:Skp family chaperone for outer membrane proteins